MLRLSFATVALAAAFTAGATARQAADTGIVPAVRAAIADGGVPRGEETLAAYRASRGTTPEALEALCWLARGALAAKLHDKASRYADEAHTAAAAAFRSPDGAHDQRLLDVLSAAVELTALTLVEQGARSEAVYGLQQALTDYGATSLRPQIESTIALVTLEGHTAPPLEAGVSVGSRLPRAGDARPQLIFFWAHWCQDCKAESPVLARIADKYRTAGLTIVAPTRRYGYVENGRSANPARELRHIVAVRDAHYPFLKKAAVPVTDANHKAYGVAAVPMHVLIDRQGVVRLYQQGRMSEAELDAAIAPLVDR